MTSALIYILGLAFAAPILTLACLTAVPSTSLFDVLFLVLPIAAGLVLVFAPAGAYLRQAAAAVALPLFYLWLKGVHYEQVVVDCLNCAR